MKCIVEVISDTLSKPNPLPISEECLETLRGDERIISILRHQNLLKELQEIAAQGGAVTFPYFLLLGAGASERTQQQKKSSGFEDELSEVLETQNDKNKQREHSEKEQPMGSQTELTAQKTQNEDSKEEGKNTLEEMEPRLQNADPGEKENREEAESNEIGDTEDTHQDEALDNHISKDFNEDEQQQREDEEEQPRHPKDSSELDKAEQTSRQGQQQKKEAAGERVEREDDRGEDAAEEDPTEAERLLDLAEEDEENEEMQGDDNNNDALGFGKDGQSSEEEEEEEEEQPRALRGRHRLEDEGMQREEDTFQSRDAKSEEMEESSREWEDSKRWNKMDELAKQLTSKKRMEDNDSEEDPDRSMKKAFRSHKYDFSSLEEDVKRSWKHHSKEDSSEGGFPLAPMPEEKKDEEGSANRRTEDQELESLAAIEAELERVAHKLHELRRG
ncbi:CMGA protein, partial [Psilopogon haemacephalus]|nr:CMGA protein [Psilopogon haemacephalus]